MDGGAIYLTQANLVIINNIFKGNSAVKGSGGSIFADCH